MDRIAAYREGLRWAFDLLEMVVEDVTAEQAHWEPPGIANPLGAVYAHAICSVDSVINVLLKGERPMFERTWVGKTGISEPRWASEINWARNLKVDLPAAREYAKAVYENAEDYLDMIDEEELDRQVDLSMRGLGFRTVSWCLTALMISHLNNMAGEISVLKGIQGSRGYPF